MSKTAFTPENTLAPHMGKLDPRACIELGVDLCAAVESSVSNGGFHGGIWPGNILYQGGRSTLGDAVERIDIKSMSPDALEYIAPEQFWSGEGSPTADVYAIGLILYTALNGGVLPFMEAGAAGAEARAAALQSRMRGTAIPHPRTAGRELGEVVLRAVAFRREDRYPTPAELRQALQALPEGAAVPAAVPVIPLTESEVKSARSYKVDKEFEKTDPAPAKKPHSHPRKERREQEKEEKEIAHFRDPKAHPSWIFPLAFLAVAIVVLILALRGCEDGGTPAPKPSPTPEQQLGETLPTPTPQPTPTPTPSPTPTPTPTPEVLPTYELVVADVSWEEAKAACEARGGHLATVKNDAQFQAIIELAEANSVKFLWLGAYRDTTDNQWRYVTGEPMTYGVWDTNEPSAFDADGTAENCLLMWLSRSRQIWCYNDTRNDPVSLLPATYSGLTAYICQFD